MKYLHDLRDVRPKYIVKITYASRLKKELKMDKSPLNGFSSIFVYNFYTLINSTSISKILHNLAKNIT